jgi:ABC-type siderophore export system fused ATPase/permease subunit
MSENDTENRRASDRFLTLDRALLAVCTILMVLCTGLTSWTMLRVFDHEGRLIKAETKADAVAEHLKEIHDDIKEIKAKVSKP